jgi:uncharacterized protein YecT (DUF1311 family)
MKKIFLIAFIALYLPNCTYAIGKISEFKDCYDHAIATIELRDCLNKELAYYDQLLNLSYKELMRVLPFSEKSKLKLAEKSWIDFKNNECDFLGFTSRDGTLEPIIIISCHIDMTKQRLNTLVDYIEIIKNY